MMRAILVALLLFVAGCASSPEDATASRNTSNCQTEYPTGSNLPVVRCRSAAQRETDKQDVEAFRDAMQRGAGTSTSSGSGR